MSLWIACLLFSTAVAVLAYRYRRTAVVGGPRTLAAAPAAARRIVNPARAGRPEVQVWRLHAGPACALTGEQFQGRRIATGDAIALPALGCRADSCSCRYEPVADARRAPRRARSDRRDAVRFELAGERRHGRDRRRDLLAWSQPYRS